MSDVNIRHVNKSKHYKAPVMLNHRTMVRIGMGVALLMVVVFASGYIMGSRQAETTIAESAPVKELTLPEPAVTDLVEVEPKIPLIIEPGEAVDVDNPDEQRVSQTGGEQQLVDQPVTQAVIQASAPASESQLILEAQRADITAVAELTPPLQAIGGPAESDPGQADEARPLAIYDNASEEDAKYSIQVGMFGRLENAARQVDTLVAADLNAYLEPFTNKNSQIRYKVLFGYFADRKSAQSALAIYVKELAGSGYVVRLQPSKDSVDKTPA